MRNDQEFSVELVRKAMHILFGATFLLLIYFDLVNPVHVFLILAIALFLSFYSINHQIPILSYLLKKYERKNLIRKFPAKGIVYFLVGILFSVLVFEIVFRSKNIALAAIAIATFGDSVSGLIGRRYGRTKNPFSRTKLIEGTIAGIAAGFFAAIIFVNWQYSLIGSSVGMFFEAIEMQISDHEFDDNVVVPLTAGIAMLILKSLMLF